jgi:hypothetical protein
MIEDMEFIKKNRIGRKQHNTNKMQLTRSTTTQMTTQHNTQ